MLSKYFVILEKKKNNEEKNKLLEKLLSEFGIDHIRYANSLSLSGGEEGGWKSQDV